MSEIKRGSTVKLNSGGPKMTVNYRTGGGWKCDWFNEQGELKSGVFSDEALTLVADN